MISERLNELRVLMKREGIHAYMILTEDFHGSEYVGSYFKCRKYMSGFTGSAGNLLVLPDMAGLWRDGRYFLEAEEQLSGSGITLFKSGEEGVPTMTEFLKEHLPQDSVLGFDGRAVNTSLAEGLRKALSEKNISFAFEKDLVGEIWKDRPALSAEKVMLLDVKYAGMERAEKLAKVRELLKEKKGDYFVLSSLDDIAWLLNIRGNDVTCNPVVLSYLALEADKVNLFINEATMSDDVKSALAKDGVVFHAYNDIYRFMKQIPAGKVVVLDESKTNYAVRNSVSDEVEVKNEKNLTLLLKAVKNATEVENERIAHIKDGVAMTKLIYWLKKNVRKLPITELSVADKLEELHNEQENYMGPSFEPIIGFAQHGAIIHYSATKESSVALEPRSLVLMDTGGQYLEGTTDITRTVALGPLTEEEKHCYTLVLRGNLNLGGAKFKQGCCGANLDYLARIPLWEEGLDYNHGTGHGVGYFLNVHEGPNNFHWKVANEGRGACVLEEGMITSNEPGLYFAGKFGIRLENLMVCKKDEKTEYGQFMCFDTLTMVPFDLDAICADELTVREKKLLNEYHKRVYDTIAPRLTVEEAMWLKEATRPIE